MKNASVSDLGGPLGLIDPIAEQMMEAEDSLREIRGVH